MKSHCLGDMTIENGGITLDLLIIKVLTPKWNSPLIIEGSGITKFLSFKMTFRPWKTWGSSKTVFPFENSFGSAFHYDCLGWLWWWFGCENFLHNIVLSAIKVCRQQTLISIKLCIKKGKEENTQIYLYLDLQGRFSGIPASVHYQRLGIPYVLYCRSLIKVKFSSDKVRRALGSCGCSSINWLIVTMLKNLKTALFQTFSTWHLNTFCPYCLLLT